MPFYRALSTNASKYFPPFAVLMAFALVVAGCDQDLSSDKPSRRSQAAPQYLPDGSLPDTSKSTSGRRIGPQRLSSINTNGVTPPGLEKALEAQERHTPELLGESSIVGTAVGLTQEGRPNVVIYTKKSKAEIRAAKAAVPARLGDTPVTFEATGTFSTVADEMSKRRPAPVGFSVGHPDITAGTIGARVKDGDGDVYLLSNNHVLADENQASTGDNILQPGPADGGTNSEDKIGNLTDYESIDFSGDNTMDAAIGRSSTAKLDNSTSNEGYGTPNSTLYTLDSDGDGNTDQGVLGLAAQKYGRTTGLTEGEVTEINATVNVGYSSGTATFVDQIVVSNRAAAGYFSRDGDSGSLIVTNDSNKNPLALLFAGGGERTVANPIKPVLSRFNVAIDGTGGDGDEPPCSDCTAYGGLLDGSGDYGYQPDGSYYYTSGGSQRGYLRGPSGVNFDLYLQKYQGGSYQTVASATSGSSDEDISYDASAGYYVWRVESQSGSGSYDFYLDKP
jgi:hypothetical protein